MSSSSSNSTTRAFVYLGASRGVSFTAYTRLAQQNKDVRSILLIRNVSAFQSSAEYKSIDPDVLARTVLIQGNAHNEDDVRKVIQEAGDALDAVVYSIGFTPPTGVVVNLKWIASGGKLDPPDLCLHGYINVLKAFAPVYASSSKKPRIVLVSSQGIGKEAHAHMNLSLRVFYNALLENVHADKLAMEVLAGQALLPAKAGSSLPRFFPAESEVSSSVMPAEDFASPSIPRAFMEPTDLCVVRPALLTDGKEVGTYRVFQEGEQKGNTVSRKDVGAFIASLLANREGEEAKKWFGHQLVIAY